MHPRPDEISSYAARSDLLGDKYVRRPRWDTYLKPAHVCCDRWPRENPRRREPPVVRDIGELLSHPAVRTGVGSRRKMRPGRAAGRSPTFLRRLRCHRRGDLRHLLPRRAPRGWVERICGTMTLPARSWPMFGQLSSRRLRSSSVARSKGSASLSLGRAALVFTSINVGRSSTRRERVPSSTRMVRGSSSS